MEQPRGRKQRRRPDGRERRRRRWSTGGRFGGLSTCEIEVVVMVWEREGLRTAYWWMETSSVEADALVPFPPLSSSPLDNHILLWPSVCLRTSHLGPETPLAMPPAKKQKLSSNQPKPTSNTTSSSTSLPAPTSALDLPYTSAGLEDDVASEQGSEQGSDSEDEQDDASDESSEPDFETFARHGRGAEPDIDEEETPSAPLTSTALPSRIKLPSRVTAPKPKPSAVPSSSVPSALPLSPTAASPPPTAPSSSKPTSSFSNLGISPALIASMGTMSIRRPTPIQAGCIPAILAGRDCIGIAQTGSGKTLAFALPILQRISRDPFGVWAVVLTPTR
jgi:hypothetical protein